MSLHSLSNEITIPVLPPKIQLGLICFQQEGMEMFHKIRISKSTGIIFLKFKHHPDWKEFSTHSIHEWAAMYEDIHKYKELNWKTIEIIP